MLQWFFLSGCVICAGFLWGRLSTVGDKLAASAFAFWSFGFALMLMEDAGNLRHTMTRVLTGLFYSDADGMSRMVVRGIQELGIYALLGFLLLWPLIRYRGEIPFSTRARRFILAGYVFYAVAAVSSASRHFGNWYVEAGGLIRRMTGTDQSALWLAFEARTLSSQSQVWHQTLNFHLMDYMLEESLELIGATCLLVGLLQIVEHLRNRAS